MIGGAPDIKDAGWQSETHKKLNDNEIPQYLCTPSNKVTEAGIDSVWCTDRPAPREFAIVEAKARFIGNLTLWELLGDAYDHSKIPAKTTGTRKRGLKKSAPASSSGAVQVGPKQGKVMQMSHIWITDRIRKDFSLHEAKMRAGKDGCNYSRHLFLVTPIQATAHAFVLAKIVRMGFVSKPVEAQIYADEHAEHRVHKEFVDVDFDIAEKKYKEVGKAPWGKQKPTGKI